ncbi:hypothetical protein PTKIN_Ptkin10aG0185900 [Pterospermum kingtungense]
MGKFVPHLVAGLALTLLGLWHTINNIRAYCLKGSSTKFAARFWHPFSGSFSRFKHLEPICFILCAELTRSSEILSPVPGILVASVLGQELLLLHFHSADHVGLEGHYHWLLQLIVFVSLLAALTTVFLPTSFSSVLLLSISVIFQGCWFINMGFMLWTPQFVPQGCTMRLPKSSSDYMLGAVACSSHEADLRARALANLQFSWTLSGVLIFTGITCLKFARKCTSTAQSTEYEELQIKGSDVPLAIDSFKL